jgi:hypothetical protein
MNETTKRYETNNKVLLGSYSINKDDLYQYGCELEFYIDTKNYNILNVIEDIKDKILSFCDVDVLVDLVNLPIDEDKNHCIQIKPDQSLEDNGIEISIPITSQKGVKYYIENLFPLIEKYGYTNEDTGLHFHISTIKTDGANFNFYLYMLMCHDKGLLSSWLPRLEYSQNVMDILSKNSKSKTRKIKTKKGTIWNLEKLATNHIEIKSIGGVDYHRDIEKVFEEFDLYVECFDSVFKDKEPEYRQRLIYEHKNLISLANKDIVKEFSIAIDEAGLI